MSFACPHCNALTDILGATVHEQHLCDCGGVLEPDEEVEAALAAHVEARQEG